MLYILSEGVDCNAAHAEYGNATALHAAASNGNSILVHILLQAGARAHVTDADLRTPLMNATENGHIEVRRST